MSHPDPKSFNSTILITGGTTGLGYNAALDLARALPSTLIVLASRTDKTSSAASINSQLSQSNVIYTPLDLSSLASTRSFATKWSTSSYPPISALLLNAGIQLPRDVEYTPDGIEKHFGINHVAHALLFHLLLPYLTPDARIVVTSSGLHDPVQGKAWRIVTRYEDAESAAHPSGMELKYAGRERYATSKSANCIWAFALGRHMAAEERHAGKMVVAFDPGLMFGTGLARETHPVLQFVGNHVLPRFTWFFQKFVHENVNPVAESAANLSWLVTSKEVDGKKAVYFEKRKEREASVQARDEKCQEDLWKWTVENIGAEEVERAKFSRL